VKAHRFHFEDGIGHQLSWTVIGCPSATVGGCHFDALAVQDWNWNEKVFPTTASPDCDDRGVLHQQQEVAASVSRAASGQLFLKMDCCPVFDCP
jgi:hypothetical protein